MAGFEDGKIRVILDTLVEVAPEMPLTDVLVSIDKVLAKTASLHAGAARKWYLSSGIWVFEAGHDNTSTHAEFIALSPAASDVRDECAASKKINAIKEFRSLTAMGLKEAKSAVEEYERVYLRRSGF